VITAVLRKTPPALWALLAGLAAAFAHPPFGLIGLILAYGGIMLLAERAPGLKSAFWRGWLSGLGYFAVSCWWVFEAFLVDAETFGWMAPFAVLLLAGGLALFWGLAMTVYRALKPRGPWRFLVFAGVLAAFEWVRGHIFTGFPWNLPGTSWEAGGLVSQSAHLFGAYGLTWITLVMGSAPAVLADNWQRRFNWLPSALALAILTLLSGYGAFRHPTEIPPARGKLAQWIDRQPKALAVRVVQPNIPQESKYDTALYAQMVNRYLALSTQPPAPGKPFPQLIVWPEGALPTSLDYYLAPGDPVREAIAKALAPGQTLIVGGFRSEGGKSYNTLAAVGRRGQDIEVIATYDKHHLVPFGEYVPRFLAAIGLQQLVPLSPFTPGPEPQPIDIGLVRIQPLICYEALFPGYVSRGAKLSGRPADLIVAISNDAWFGQTSGPWQHHNQARYRAIEEGLPMIRATPTGVSSVIDKYGQVYKIDRLGLGEAGVIDAVVYVRRGKNIAGPNDVDLTLLRTWSFLVMLMLSGLVSVSFYARSIKKSVT